MMAIKLKRKYNPKPVMIKIKPEIKISKHEMPWGSGNIFKAGKALSSLIKGGRAVSDFNKMKSLIKKRKIKGYIIIS
ncbi:hypothetical protein [Cytobacillus praedii]|uniref:hypothetical protein n=1 Tax=Cytobacillus praedii TaxID=1742358 RepID=UPI002E1B3CD3|nr:hypothetical protein [Cytobacillus praedii]